MTTAKSSVVVIDWHQLCEVPTQLQLSTTDKEEKRRKKKSVLCRLLLHSSALGFTWETQPCNQLGSANQERGVFFLPSFLPSFLPFCLPFCLSFYLSFFTPSLPSFFFPLLSWHQNFFIAPLIQLTSLSFIFSPPLHIYTHMQTLLRKRGKGMGDRERKYECV